MTEETKQREQVKLATNLYQAWQKLIPDSRLARPRLTILGPLGIMEQCFCVNCARAGGFVTQDGIEHVLYLCDECVAKHGHLPMPQIPEEFVRTEEHTAHPEGG